MAGTSMSERIRPRAGYLEQLPTLDVTTPDRGVPEELKETDSRLGQTDA